MKPIARKLAAVLVLLFVPFAACATDPSALWHIVHDRCVPNEEAHDKPAPCTLVDLERGYVVLKDIVGATQFLVLPTARITGIESPALLAPGGPNYMQDAWAARRFVRARAPAPLSREDLSLAVNSIHGRSQNQLHIHVDCLRVDVHDALGSRLADLSDSWRPFPVPLAGERYIARRLISSDLAGVNPFVLLADSSPEARAHMSDYTLVLAGASFAGVPGFILLADRADPIRGNFGSGEALQDHQCALAHP
ncbi:MAG TPA: CDP-diacylglycerol diphosphatase [Acetobacteraceae bacterium]|nr:CDP-diacylglycerol diphosphatase [Acetobacteraceae bacterium]